MTVILVLLRCKVSLAQYGALDETNTLSEKSKKKGLEQTQG